MVLAKLGQNIPAFFLYCRIKSLANLELVRPINPRAVKIKIRMRCCALLIIIAAVLPTAADINKLNSAATKVRPDFDMHTLLTSLKDPCR